MLLSTARGEEVLLEVTTICRVEGQMGRLPAKSQEGPRRLEMRVVVGVGSSWTGGESAGAVLGISKGGITKEGNNGVETGVETRRRTPGGRPGG
jgi:hypothetical protein